MEQSKRGSKYSVSILAETWDPSLPTEPNVDAEAAALSSRVVPRAVARVVVVVVVVMVVMMMMVRSVRPLTETETETVSEAEAAFASSTIDDGGADDRADGRGHAGDDAGNGGRKLLRY